MAEWVNYLDTLKAFRAKDAMEPLLVISFTPYRELCSGNL